jgi:hypothetical protein
MIPLVGAIPHQANPHSSTFKLFAKTSTFLGFPDSHNPLSFLSSFSFPLLVSSIPYLSSHLLLLRSLFKFLASLVSIYTIKPSNACLSPFSPESLLNCGPAYLRWPLCSWTTFPLVTLLALHHSKLFCHSNLQIFSWKVWNQFPQSVIIAHAPHSSSLNPI